MHDSNDWTEPAAALILMTLARGDLAPAQAASDLVGLAEDADRDGRRERATELYRLARHVARPGKKSNGS